mmetsp:Transcript_32925/g.76678  ORF Transcript_32925/g.76678 Transcript_32925/m.76678 type:complete len:225 (-) Transcript_32925:842-1516(-)
MTNSTCSLSISATRVERHVLLSTSLIFFSDWLSALNTLAMSQFSTNASHARSKALSSPCVAICTTSGLYLRIMFTRSVDRFEGSVSSIETYSRQRSPPNLTMKAFLTLSHSSRTEISGIPFPLIPTKRMQGFVLWGSGAISRASDGQVIILDGGAAMGSKHGKAEATGSPEICMLTSDSLPPALSSPSSNMLGNSSASSDETPTTSNSLSPLIVSVVSFFVDVK